MQWQYDVRSLLRHSLATEPSSLDGWSGVKFSTQLLKSGSNVHCDGVLHPFNCKIKSDATENKTGNEWQYYIFFGLLEINKNSKYASIAQHRGGNARIDGPGQVAPAKAYRALRRNEPARTDDR